jgi:transcriptional regulator with XRE-family HTH domain
MKKNDFPDKEYKVKIGGNIRKWRNLKGIKQKELASILKLSEAAISNMENDLTDLTLSQLEDISMALDIPVEQLFTDPQETFTLPLSSINGKQNHVFEKELLNAVITSMQKKDEQLQTIMQNVLHTMTVIVQDEKKFI